jgi:hypothetical protein
MGTRPISAGTPGATTASAAPDALHGALVVAAAAAGLVWALSRGSSEGARDEPAPQASPHLPRPAR